MRIPIIISTVLICMAGLYLCKLRKLQQTNSKLFEHYRQLAENGKYGTWQRGGLALDRLPDEFHALFLTELLRLRRRSCFLLMLAITHLILSVVGSSWPICISIAFSLCFPITFGLKNIQRLLRREVRAGLFAQSVLALMIIGVFGTLLQMYWLENLYQVPWWVTLPLAASVSLFNSINWHQYLILGYRKSSSSLTLDDYSGYDNGVGNNSYFDSEDSNFGGGSSGGGGAGESW